MDKYTITKNGKLKREKDEKGKKEEDEDPFDTCKRRVLGMARMLEIGGYKLKPQMKFQELWKKKKFIDECFDEVVELHSLAKFHNRTLSATAHSKIQYITELHTTACQLINAMLAKNDEVVY